VIRPLFLLVACAQVSPDGAPAPATAGDFAAVADLAVPDEDLSRVPDLAARDLIALPDLALNPV